MTTNLRDLELAYVALMDQVDADLLGDDALIRAAEEAWHAVADEKDDRGLCLQLWCRRRSPDHAYCPQHR